MAEMVKVSSFNGFRGSLGLDAAEMDKNILKYCKISSLLIAEFRILYPRIQN
jgi:hypothetical protein